MQVLDTEKEHSVDVLRNACGRMQSVLSFVGNAGEIDSTDEHAMAQTMEDILCAVEYLWIQTGISLPTSVSQEKLMSNLREAAADLKVKRVA